MKKFLLLLCTLLASVGVGNLWATVTTGYALGSKVTSAAGIVDGNKYVIRVNSGSYITEATSQYEAPNSQNAITANAVFTFHQNGEEWNVECEATGNYWGTLTGKATGTFATAEAASAGNWTFTFSDNKISLTSNGFYINRSGGVMHGWDSTIALQIYNVEVVDNFVTAIGDLSNNKAYYVTTMDRGAWFVANSGTAITSTTVAGFAPSMSDVKQQFAFLTYGTTGIYHLYSVSEGKFVSRGDEASNKRTKLTSELGDNVTLLATTNANYPFVVALQDGAYHMGISNGYDPAVITFWNSLTDAGNQVQIREVADFDPTEAMAILEAEYSTTVTVTYSVYDGETFVESQKVVQDKNSAVSVPNALKKNTWYYDYTPSGTIGETDCTITVARTYKSGVVTAVGNLSNNKAYKLVTERGTFTTDNGALANTCKTGSNYTVYNFAIVYYDGTDDSVDNGSYYLWSVQDGKFVAGSSTNLTETPTAITINALTEPLFKFQCGSNYMNCNTGEGGFFSTWSTTDGGNKVAIIEAADFDPAPVIAAITNVASSVVANIKPFFDGAGDDLFQLKSSVAEANNATYTAALTMCSPATYDELLAVISNAENFNLPETGKYYLVKNNYNNKYLRVDTCEKRGRVFADLTAAEAAKDASAHIYFEENGGKLYMKSQTQYFNWVYNNWSGYEGYVVGTKDKYVHFAAPAPGAGAFSIAYGNGEGGYAGYLGIGFYALKNNESTIVTGSTTDQTNALAQWTFEEVSSITIDLNTLDGKSYATTKLPFGVTLGGDVKAYKVAISGEYAIPTEIGSEVPAGTPVLLVSESGAASVTATIDDDATGDVSDNALEGIYFAASPSAYVLNIVESELGFYVLDGTLDANKAYLPKATPVKGFVLNWNGETSVQDIKAALAGNTIYNLAGQRVKKAQKGVYIVDGQIIAIP